MYKLTGFPVIVLGAQHVMLQLVLNIVRLDDVVPAFVETTSTLDIACVLVIGITLLW